MIKNRVLDLFCGAGGFSEGFKQAGFEIVAAIDNDEKALKAHELNHPETDHIIGEIGKTDLSFLSKTNADVIIGSPPCPNFSVANTTNKDAKEGMRLVYEFIKLIKKIKPKYWIGENVPPSQSIIERSINTRGYVFNAADFGVPQKRRRYFFGDYPKPTSTHAIHATQNLFGDKLEKWLTIEDIMDHNENDWMEFNNLPKTAKRRVLDFGYQKIPKFKYFRMIYPNKPSETIVAHKDTGNLLLVDAANSSASGQMAQRLNEPGWTIMTRQNYFIYNKVKFRKLSLLELKRIMGFPDNYQFYGTRVDQIKQNGNAVCPPMAKALGEAILNGNPTQDSLEGFL